MLQSHTWVGAQLVYDDIEGSLGSQRLRVVDLLDLNVVVCCCLQHTLREVALHLLSSGKREAVNTYCCCGGLAICDTSPGRMWRPAALQ